MDMLRAVLLGVTLAVACLIDMRRRRVPNSLTFPALLAGLVLAGVQDGLPGVGLACAGVGVASVALLFYAARMLGAGDVKLLWAVGALMGPRFAGATLVCMALAGGLLGLAWMLRRREARLPYAPAIALGSVAVFWLRHGAARPW